MDKNKLIETMNILNSCESNLRDFSSKSLDEAEKSIYKRAYKDIARIENTLKTLMEDKSLQTSEFNQLDSNKGNENNNPELPSNVNIKSVKVVDSNDIIAPSKLPEL